MVYVITDSGIDRMDQSSIRECPAGRFYEGKHQLFVNPHGCIDCAGEAGCPQKAIDHEGDPPESAAYAVERQGRVFEESGRLGGARKYGKLPTSQLEQP